MMPLADFSTATRAMGPCIKPQTDTISIEKVRKSAKMTERGHILTCHYVTSHITLPNFLQQNRTMGHCSRPEMDTTAIENVRKGVKMTEREKVLTCHYVTSQMPRYEDDKRPG